MFLVHRDIKPDNFLLDITFNIKKESITDYFEHNGEIYLIDFGLCKRYDYNGVHIEQKKISSIIGSYNFVSLNVLNGIEPSRRDDIESSLYVMIYMCLGNLHWVPNKANILEYITIPNVIKQLLLYVKTLEFASQPDYKLIYDILLTKNDIKR
jgi:serine/threonine protein kinase